MARGNPQPWFRKSRNTWYVTIDGVQHNLHTSDKDEAYDQWHKLMVEREESHSSEASPEIDVAHLLALFADHCEKHRAASTYERYRGYLQGFVKSVPEGLRVSELRPFHVTQWLDREPGWGPTTRHSAITVLKRAFNWAVDEGYLDRSPLTKVRKPRRRRRETVLTEEQRKLILEEASDREFRDLLTLAGETGCRPQELRTLEARHVDLENGLWLFPTEENKTGEKTGQPRIVYLTPAALEISRRLAKKHPTGPMLRNSKGKPWTRNAIRCRFRRLRNRLNGKLPPNLCMYLFRHSFATDALQRGVDAVTLAELMGHKDPTMVAQVYQHINQRVAHMRQSALRATGGNVSGQDD